LNSGGKGEFSRRTLVKKGHFREAGKSEIRKRKPRGIKCLKPGQTLNFGKLLANVTNSEGGTVSWVEHYEL
jgi:hypothetical protein